MYEISVEEMQILLYESYKHPICIIIHYFVKYMVRFTTNVIHIS